MKLSYESAKKMAFNSEDRQQNVRSISRYLDHSFCHTSGSESGEFDANSLTSSLLTLPLCDQPEADCSPSSSAMPPQQGPVKTLRAAAIAPKRLGGSIPGSVK